MRVQYIRRIDTISTSGRSIPQVHRKILSTSGRYHACGGYRKHIGGCSVHRGDIMSTLGDIMSTWGMFSTLQDNMMHLGDIMSTSRKRIN